MVGSPGRGGLEVHVQTPKLQTDFSVKRNTTGKQLFDQVADILELEEVWFFGLQFVDHEGNTVWLQPKERLTSRAARRKQSPLQFNFCVRFWPQEAAWTLGDVATELLFLQVRSAVLDGTLSCPLGTAIELAAYALQARFGDFIDPRLESGQLTRNPQLPQKLECQLRGATEQWQERVATLHRQRRGLPRRDAMHEYLHRAQQLPGYGVTFSNIRCEHPLGGQPAGRQTICWFWMGISPFGVNVYEEKLTPLLRLPWEQLRSVRYHNSKFTINLFNSDRFQFFTRSLRMSEELLATINGQMKANAQQVKNGDGEELSAAAGNSFSEEVGESLAEGGAELGHDQHCGCDVEEDAEHQTGKSLQWVEPLAASGWLEVVQQWRREERTAGRRNTQPAIETSLLPRRTVQQSVDSGLASWSGSTSDALTSADAKLTSADAQLTSSDAQLTSSDAGLSRYSTASGDSGVFRLSVRSAEEFFV